MNLAYPGVLWTPSGMIPFAHHPHDSPPQRTSSYEIGTCFCSELITEPDPGIRDGLCALKEPTVPQQMKSHIPKNQGNDTWQRRWKRKSCLPSHCHAHPPFYSIHWSLASVPTVLVKLFLPQLLGFQTQWTLFTCYISLTPVSEPFLFTCFSLGVLGIIVWFSSFPADCSVFDILYCLLFWISSFHTGRSWILFSVSVFSPYILKRGDDIHSRNVNTHLKLLNLYPAQTWFLSSRLIYPTATKTNSASSSQIYSFSSPILGELYPVTQARSIGFFSLGSLGLELQESRRSLFALKFHHVLISLNFIVLIHKNENNNIHLKRFLWGCNSRVPPKHPQVQ